MTAICKGYGGSMSDWTALDPAIVSFRQFPSVSGECGRSHLQQDILVQCQPYGHDRPPPPSQQQQTQSDMFMPPPHLNQLQSQMNGQSLFDSSKLKSDYSNRMQSGYGGPHGINLQNSIINQQQPNSPAQVNANVQGMLEFLKNRQFF